MIFTTIAEKIKELRQTREEEPSIKKEIVTNLVKIKKNLFENRQKNINDSIYLTINDINPDLTPFREISRELRSDGFVVNIYDVEEDTDVYFNVIFIVDLIIEKNGLTKEELNKAFNQSLDQQLQKLGINLTVVNNEITKHKPSYENIMNGALVDNKIINNEKIGKTTHGKKNFRI